MRSAIIVGGFVTAQVATTATLGTSELDLVKGLTNLPLGGLALWVLWKIAILLIKTYEQAQAQGQAERVADRAERTADRVAERELRKAETSATCMAMTTLAAEVGKATASVVNAAHKLDLASTQLDGAAVCLRDLAVAGRTSEDIKAASDARRRRASEQK